MTLAAVVGIIAGYTYRLVTGEFGGPWSWAMVAVTLVTTVVVRFLLERIARHR